MSWDIFVLKIQLFFWLIVIPCHSYNNLLLIWFDTLSSLLKVCWKAFIWQLFILLTLLPNPSFWEFYSDNKISTVLQVSKFHCKTSWRSSWSHNFSIHWSQLLLVREDREASNIHFFQEKLPENISTLAATRNQLIAVGQLWLGALRGIQNH